MPAPQEEAGAALLRFARAVERAAFLDPLGARLATLAEAAFRRPAVRRFWRGTWLGHAFHPLLTDFTEGAWMAASFLDLFGPRGSAPAARRLLGFGLAAAVPTYAAGLADLADARRDGERRVGAAHAVSISLAMALYAASYAARVKGRQRRATSLGVAAGALAFVDGYLGGHLGHVRGVAAGETTSRIH